MRGQHTGVIFAFLMLCCIFQKSNAITCYSCSNSKDCNDDFNSASNDVSTLDSSADCIYCTKYTYIDHAAGTRYVTRNCIRSSSYKSVDNMGCIKCEDQDPGESCKTETITCYCDQDDCNHGNMNGPLFVLVLAIISLKMILI